MPGGHKKDACGCGATKEARSVRCVNCVRGITVMQPAGPPKPAAEVVAEDRERRRQATAAAALQAKYTEALKTIGQQQLELEAIGVLGRGLDPSGLRIVPRLGSGTSEGTVVMVGSDWHIEENVNPDSVSGLNTFNVETAQQRVTRFFQSGLRLIRLLQQDIKIENLALPLLGDFITNDIHDAENAELNELLPTHAIVTAQNMLIGGIEFLLNNSKLAITLNCHSGNHARTTKTTRFGAENGHSLEYLMYLHLAAYFRGEPRVRFNVAAGMHSYLDVYDTTIRFHHGHAVKYGGGVGGIYIPVNKAIAQWNKGRHADLDVFGHFHQMRDGGNFICNGSLIGYNSFALSIKADYEPPRQALFLVDKKRGRTCTWPILVQ